LTIDDDAPIIRDVKDRIQTNSKEFKKIINEPTDLKKKIGRGNYLPETDRA